MPTQKPAEETPRKKFERLAESRVTKGLAAVGLIEQLANPQRYEYTPADVDAIESALNASVSKAIAALRAGKVQTAHFTLATGE